MSNIKAKKGIILAGGKGSRLYPITKVISKQIIPICNKPMIYYPLSTLMLAGIRDILIITAHNEKENFRKLLGDGKNFGINIEYAEQKKPEGLAQSLLIGKDFINNSPIVLILGDNLFHGQNLINKLKNGFNKFTGSTIFAYPVSDPERYGIIEFDNNFKVLNVEEKPENPKSIYAITGLYFFDETAVERAAILKPSIRGELEITDLIKSYLADKELYVELLGRGMAWIDTGTFDSLHQANDYIRALESRQGLKVSCPEEIAWRKKWISDEELENLAKTLIKNSYGEYLTRLLKENKFERSFLCGDSNFN